MSLIGQDGAVEIVGRPPAGGKTIFRAVLGHGEDPAALAHDRGFTILHPLEASRASNGELVVSFAARPAAGDPPPRRRRRGRDSHLAHEPGVEPVVRQRLAAYAVVRSARGLLATEYSARTAVAGRWGMPGGGIDPGEEPTDTVLREVVEETSQRVTLSSLQAVQTSHWVGRSPSGVVEDFHAVRLVYLGDCPDPTEPVVVDSEGTTASARWVPLAGWRSLRWTANWREILEGLMDGKREATRHG